jgi:hypothetical protein
MLPFVTIGKQMSVVLDMTSHGLFRVQMLVPTFLPSSHLASILVDFGRHVMQHIFSSVVCGGFSTYKMPAAVGICLKKNSPFLFLFSHDNNKNHEKKKGKKEKRNNAGLYTQ